MVLVLKVAGFVGEMFVPSCLFSGNLYLCSSFNIILPVCNLVVQIELEWSTFVSRDHQPNALDRLSAF